MRYIKEYTQTFMEIDRDEYIWKEGEGTFSPDEKIFNDYVTSRIDNLCISWYNFAIYVNKYMYKNPADCVIEELPDEWFLIKDISRSKFYKCDQLQGVVDCLKEILAK